MPVHSRHAVSSVLAVVPARERERSWPIPLELPLVWELVEEWRLTADAVAESEFEGAEAAVVDAEGSSIGGRERDFSTWVMRALACFLNWP